MDHHPSEARRGRQPFIGTGLTMDGMIMMGVEPVPMS